MTAIDFHPKNFSPFRVLTQLGTARYLLMPLYKWRNNFKVHGRENIPKDGKPLLIVANHLSYWDPPALVIAVDKPMGFVAKEELTKNEKFSKLIEYYSAITVKRDKPEKRTVKAVRDIFKRNWSVTMFIEGTRAKTPGVLGRPHLGAAYFAKSNKVPILPVGLVGLDTKHKQAYAHIGKIIQPSDDLVKTTWEIMDALAELTGGRIGERELADSEAE